MLHKTVRATILQKADQEGDKPCSCIEYEQWGYLTLQPEIQNSRSICDDAVDHKVGKPDFQVKVERTVSSSNVGNIPKELFKEIGKYPLYVQNRQRMKLVAEEIPVFIHAERT